MAYTPINWQTGDTITAEKMNKMDNGWGVQNAQLFSETVTTEDTGEGYSAGELSYTTFLSADTITVTLNGTDYVCSKIDFDGANAYGGLDIQTGSPDFTDYPFLIYSANGDNQLITQTAGAFTISVTTSNVEVSSDFGDAVHTCIGSPLPFLCINEVTTYQEMYNAKEDGRLLYFYSEANCHFVNDFNAVESPTAVLAIPAGVENIETYGFTDDGEGNLIFTIFVY